MSHLRPGKEIGNAVQSVANDSCVESSKEREMAIASGTVSDSEFGSCYVLS